MLGKPFVLIVGAFSIFYIGYEMNERGLLIPIAFVGLALFVAYLVTRSSLNTQAKTLVRTATKRKIPMPSDLQSRSVTIEIDTYPSELEPEKAINEALDALPKALRVRSGSVFYTGKDAFKGNRAVYLLGLNPGGNPEAQSANTVAKHIEEFRARAVPWSAYADDRWEGAAPGTWGMQPRVLHMLAGLGLDPRLTPASNLIFVRSRGEADLKTEKAELLRYCWPVHRAVIDSLQVRAIICFGSTAGRWTREQLRANELLDQFIEKNGRRWKSEAHRAASGHVVVTTTHPGRVDWRNPDADPTPMIRRVLGS